MQLLKNNMDKNRHTPDKDRMSQNTDLPDSPHDAERLQPDETIMDLPDVADIPGQEHVQAPQLGELADTMASSADEEGDEIFNDTAGSDTTNSDES